MPGQEHAGLAEELPAGGLPKDKQCQAPSCFQRSTSWSRRLLWAGPQHPADPGEPTVGDDTQHTPLCRGTAKRLLPVAKQLRCHGSDPNSPGVVSPRGTASWNCAPSSASCTHGLEGRRNSHGKGSTRVRHPAALQGPVLLGHNPSLERAPGHGKGPSMVRVGMGKLQASFQAGSSQPDPWEGLKGE